MGHSFVSSHSLNPRKIRVTNKNKTARAKALLFVLFRNWIPGFVRIEALHLREFAKGAGPEVLLEDNTVLADDEGLYARLSVLGGCGDESKAADHYSLHDIVHLAERRRGSLPFQNLEKVSMVWLCTGRISLFDRLRNLFANWAAPTAIRVLPS